MQTALWVASGLLAVGFLISGLVKILVRRPRIETIMPFSRDFSDAQVRTIGALEVLGAIGVILPALTGVLPWLTVAAAFGLAILMIGAIVVHIRRREVNPIPINVGLLAVALFVGFGRLLG